MTSVEIDKLCGLHVMEWNFKPGVEGSWYEYDNLVATEDWSPSTDISDAWQVLETVKSRGYSAITQTLEDGWVCSFNGELFGIARADTAPMAICLAALETFGIPR